MSKMERDALFMRMRGAGITLKEISKNCDVSSSMLSQFFKHKANMNKNTIDLVVTYIDLKLLDGEV